MNLNRYFYKIKAPKSEFLQPNIKILRFSRNLVIYISVTLLKPMKAFPNYYMGSDPTSESRFEVPGTDYWCLLVCGTP
jgi:hypothetical protein